MRAITSALVSLAILAVGSAPTSAQINATPPFEAGTVTAEHAINGVDTVVGSDGNILYVWDNGTSYTYHGSLLPAPSNVVLARVYTPDGAPILDSESRADTSGRMSMWISAGRSGDGYLVAWKSTIPSGDSFYEIMLGRRLDASGVPMGAEVPIDLDTSDFQDVPVVAGLADGGSVVVWLRTGHVVARVFDAAAQPIGERFTVAGNYSWDGHGHDVAALANGDFVVVWSSWHLSGESGMRIYAPDGEPRSGVLPPSAGFQPSLVAAGPSGGFVTAGFTAADGYKSLRLRYYESDGSPLSEDIVVRAMTGDYYIMDADLRVLADGNVAVEWREYTRSGFQNLRVQLYDPSGAALGSWAELPGTSGLRLKTALLDDGRLVNAWTAASQIRLYLNGVWTNLVSFSSCMSTGCPPSPTVPPTPTATNTSPPQPTPTPAPSCGDGATDEGEECDDGNRRSGDGCDSNCRIEDCGNGRFEGLEECDDGNNIDGDGCQSDCTETPMHDSVVRPEKPIDVVIPANQNEVTKVVPLQVRNADDGELPGHIIQLVAKDGTCPVGTIRGLPDFERGIDGDQDSALVKGGTPATALVIVAVRREDFSGVDHKVPLRCTLTFSAVSLVAGNVEPTPENNTIEVEVNVTAAGNDKEALSDGSRLSLDGLPEFFVRSAKPLKLKIGRGKRGQSKTVPLAVASGAASLADARRTVQVTAFDGDCPSGTLALIDFDSATQGPQGSIEIGGATNRTGKLVVKPTTTGFASRDRHHPARCRATLIATSPQGDSGAASHTTAVVIEVLDLNDF